MSGPIIDLRDATRRVGAGDLGVRVPVVSTDETGELAASFNAMVAGLGERERLREAFGAFVDPAVTERVLAEGADLRGEAVEVSLVFLDVRGFTAVAESTGAHEVVGRLNTLYEAVVPVILSHGGHANKFIGDGLLAVFGAPERHADHAARAVAAAREIAQLVRKGRAGDLEVGVGVNSGRVVVGTIGGGRAARLHRHRRSGEHGCAGRGRHQADRGRHPDHGDDAARHRSRRRRLRGATDRTAQGQDRDRPPICAAQLWRLSRVR